MDRTQETQEFPCETDDTELRESENRLNAFFVDSPVRMAIVDARFRYVKVNETTARYFGKRVDEIIGKTASEINPVFGPVLEKIIQKVLQTGNPEVNIEISGEMPSRPGEIINWTASYFPLTLPDGEKGVGVIAVDITDRVRAEETLRLIVENSHDVIFFQDQNLRYTWIANPNTPSAEERVPGKTDAELPHFLDSERIMEIKRDVLETGETRRSEQRILVNGEVRWFDDAYSPRHDADGKIIGLFGYARDITERKQAENALRESEERYRNLVETAEEGVWVLDTEGKTTFVNPKLASLFGYAPEEIIGKNVLEFVPEDERETVLQRLERRNAGERDRYDYRYVRKDGSTLWTIVSGTPLRDRDGQVIGVLAMLTDITERKNAEEHVRQLNDLLVRRTAQLQAANKEMEAFSYSVSHDLRAPLRSIDGFSLALQEDFSGKLGEEGEDYLRRIRAAAQRMGQLIEDLLNLSRVTRVELHQTEVNLSGIARSILEDLRRTDPQRQVETVIQEGVTALGGEDLLRQVLANLLGNAWKFTSKTPQARIEFGETQQDGRRAFYVRDNGAGFDMQYVDRLFLPFRRLHSETEFPGTGIGLSIVRRIIQKHGGSVWAEGETGKGATFYFTLE